MRILLLLAVVYSAQAAEWSYKGDHGPNHWGDDYPLCNGNAQSPINIDSSTAKEVMLPNFRFSGYGDLDLALTNNGHSAVAGVSRGTAEMVEGGLGGKFRLAQFHFHWGTAGILNKGSEHTIDGTAYPLEVHFVHYNTKYPDIGAAIDKPDGLAVLGFMFEVNEAKGLESPFMPLFDALHEIEEPGKEHLATFQNDMVGDFLEDSYTGFYRYQGSLTTPACYETVKWTVFQDVMPITQDSLNKFYKLAKNVEGDLIVDNFRPLMPLNGREVHHSTQVHNNAPTVVSASLSLLLGLALTTLWL